MTNTEFTELYQESLSRLNAYISTQVSPQQITSAKHHLYHVEKNEEYYRRTVVEKGAPVYLCVKCGALETANFTEKVKAQLESSKTCFRCNHWEQLAANPRDNFLIIDGWLYSDGGKSSAPSHCLGFGGAKWKISKDGKEWETNNLWSGGTIPEEFRSRLPDNAKFL